MYNKINRLNIIDYLINDMGDMMYSDSASVSAFVEQKGASLVL